MKTIWKMLLLLAVGLVWAGCGQQSTDIEGGSQEGASQAKGEQAESAEGGIQWAANFEAAMAKAKEEEKPIMVDFFATWCGPCKMLDQQTYSDPAVIEAAQEWVSVKVDVDQEQDLAAKYDVAALPTIAFMTPEGEVKERIVGFIKAKEMKGKLEAAHGKMAL